MEIIATIITQITASSATYKIMLCDQDITFFKFGRVENGKCIGFTDGRQGNEGAAAWRQITTPEQQGACLDQLALHIEQQPVYNQ